MKIPAVPPGAHQLSLLFDSKQLTGLSATDRSKVILVLAQILMQAAGVLVEELDDDGR